MVGDLVCERAIPPAGKRPYPLLFVHGMWLGTWCWANYLAAAVDRGWDAWAVTLRGHLFSRPVPDRGTVSVRDYARDIQDTLDRVGPAVLVGHSMGGLAAQLVAVCDKRVRAVALVASVPPRGILPLSAPALLRIWRYLPWLLRERAFRLRGSDVRAMLTNRLAASAHQDVLQRLVPASGRAAREILTGVAVRAKAVSCPTLVVGARHDRLTPVWMQRRIAERYGADYLESAAHGHMLMIEDGWETIASQIFSWLEAGIS